MSEPDQANLTITSSVPITGLQITFLRPSKTPSTSEVSEVHSLETETKQIVPPPPTPISWSSSFAALDEDNDSPSAIVAPPPPLDNEEVVSNPLALHRLFLPVRFPLHLE